MTKNGTFAIVAASAALFIGAAHATAAVQITEFCSNSGDGQDYEFVEITNTGTIGQDMTGWSEDDGTRSPNKSQHSLSGFGTLAPGESAIFTEANPDAFRTYWWGSVAAAPAGLKIVGPYGNDNLSSSGDEVNLYNGATLVDRVTYNGSLTAPSGGGNASGVTRNAPEGYVINSNRNIDFIDSSIGDAFDSFSAANNSSLIGNPGSYVVPEPASLSLLGVGALALVRRRRAR